MSQIQLVDRRVFAAPAALLFRAWTEPDLLARWWGPHAAATVDLRVGGGYRMVMVLPDGTNLAAHGTYTEIASPDRLSFTFAWEGGDEPETYVTIAFRDLGGTAEMVLTHTGFRYDEERENHVLGWRDCLDRYGKLIGELMV